MFQIVTMDSFYELFFLNERQLDGGGLLFRGCREGVALLRHELIWGICTDGDEMPFSFLFVKIAKGEQLKI